MNIGQATLHRVDADDVIVYVDPTWEEFARDNGAHDLAARVLGTPLWNHIHGGQVQEISRDLTQQVRGSQRSITFPFRCDAPGLRRFMAMEIVPLEGGLVEFRSRLLRSEARPPVPVPLEGEGTSLAMVCAWCKRFRCGEGWCEVEEAVRSLDLLMTAEELRVSHGICEACYATQHELWKRGKK